MLFRKALSLSSCGASVLAGSRTSIERRPPFGLEKEESEVAGVGTLLVSRVEYSLSVEASRVVGAEETDLVPPAEARLGLPALVLTKVGVGDGAADDSPLIVEAAFDGRPRGRFVVPAPTMLDLVI